MRDNLEFRGTWADLFGTIIIVVLLSIITLGLYLPWGYVKLRKVILTHTYYQGQPLNFDGSGAQAFGQILIVVILSVITLGFYAILGFAAVRMLRWEAEHTILPSGTRLEYRGGVLDLFIEMLILGLLTGITFGIYYFFGYARLRRHIIGNTYAGRQPLHFTGTGRQYFGVSFINFLLTFVTLGIYSLLGFAAVRELRWDTENTHLPPQPTPQGTVESTGQPIHVTVNVNQPQ